MAAKVLETMKRSGHYKTQTWLNPVDSSSTGSIVCYDGDIEYTEGLSYCTFVEIADCHSKVRLHRSHTDSHEDFVEKVDSMIDALVRFRHHLTTASPHKESK